MAKIGGERDSGTSQWFSKMRVTPPPLATASRIAALQAVNTTWFPELPVTGWQSGTPIQRHNVVRITGVTEFPAQQSASDRIFSDLEAVYPQYTVPSQGSAGEAPGCVFRHYGGSQVCVGTKDKEPGRQPGELRSIADWLAPAQAAGY